MLLFVYLSQFCDINIITYIYIQVNWGLKKFKQFAQWYMCSVSWRNSEFKPGLYNPRTCYTISVTMIKNL